MTGLVTGSRKPRQRGKLRGDARGRQSKIKRAASPLRPVWVLATLAVVFAVAIPIYVWRSPATDPRPYGALSVASSAGSAREASGNEHDTEAVQFGTPRVAACGATARSLTVPGNQCDAQPFFEQALVTTLAGHPDCFPEHPGRSEFWLQIDYRAPSIEVTAHEPKGSFSVQEARKTARCVLDLFPPVPWKELPHSHAAYRVLVNVTFLKVGP